MLFLCYSLTENSSGAVVELATNPSTLTIGSVSVTAILDEDNFASNSATSLATQQSIKAYVDSTGSGTMTSWILEDGDGTEVSVSNAKEVTLKRVEEPVEALGAWYDMKPGTAGLALTGRIIDDTFYAMMDIAGIFQECGGCADTLRLIPKDKSKERRDIKLDPLVLEATGSEKAHVSHTGDISMLNGKLTGFF